MTEATATNAIVAVIVAAVWILGTGLIAEPNRRTVNAIILAVAAGVYLDGGLGSAEFAFAILIGILAYRGLSSYTMLGMGWLLHTGWDIVHHVQGLPMIGAQPASAFSCAITDPIIALWFLLGAPSPFRRRSPLPSAQAAIP